MVKIDIFGGSQVVLSRTPSWSKKSMCLKRDAWAGRNPSQYQVNAWVNLAAASRQAAAQTTGLSGSTRVNAMNELVRQQLQGKTYNPNPIHVRTHPFSLEAWAQKYGIGGVAGGRAAPAAALGGGAWY